MTADQGNPSEYRAGREHEVMGRERILKLLLEAEPAELRGVGNGEVARLVRERADVRALAARVLAGLADTNAALDALSARSPMPRPARDGIERAPGRLRPRLAAGLALAAIAVLLLRSPQGVPPEGGPPASAGPGLAAGLAAGADRPFAVFETENPDIVIVWLFPEEETR